MKRFVLLFLCLIFALTALSEAEKADPFACDCEFEEEKGEVCACFLQMGDIGPAVNGVIMHLMEKGYLPFSHARGVFDEEVAQAVRRFQRDSDLDETGVFDHETLSYLLLYPLPGETGASQKEDRLMWVPTDGGDHLHTNKGCSNMIAPRKISERNALALGIEPCEHCFKEGYEHDETLAGLVYGAGTDTDA